MEPTKKSSAKVRSEAKELTEPDPKTRDIEWNPEASESTEEIVQDLLGDFSEQTGASFG